MNEKFLHYREQTIQPDEERCIVNVAFSFVPPLFSFFSSRLFPCVEGERTKDKSPCSVLDSNLNAHRMMSDDTVLTL